MGFDRHPAIKQMLDAVRAEAIRQERERIIALLETKAEYFMDCWDEEYDTAGLIALIKGENE